jgi:AraC-like DNA-binding protein
MDHPQRSGLADTVHGQGAARLNETRIGGVIADAFAVRASAPGSAARASASTLHAQHGAGLLVGLDGDVLVTAPGRPPVRARVVAVPPDLLHAAHGEGPGVGLLYDPELAPHVAGFARARGGAFAVEDRLAARLLDAATQHRASLGRADVLAGLAQEASRWIADTSPPRCRLDRRVARLLDALRAPELDRRAAAGEGEVSAAHLRALFVRDVGVPIRAFRLWRRLLAAVEALARVDATRAAHTAGFADLAHFSRTCRRMLGYSPTELRDGGP